MKDPDGIGNGTPPIGSATPRPAEPSDAPPLFLSDTVVLIPALNEAEIIASTVTHWIALGALEVRVVDNGSHDDTGTKAFLAGARVISESKKGYGAAAATGLKQLPAKARWILFISADNSDRFDPSEYASWQSAVDQGAQLVLGDRCAMPHSARHLRIPQRIGSSIFRCAAFLGWGVRFGDMGSRRLLRIDTLDRLNLKDRGFGWNVEMQIRAVETGLSIVEIPSYFHPREGGVSKISGNLVGLLRAAHGILATLAQLWLTRRHRRLMGAPKPES